MRKEPVSDAERRSSTRLVLLLLILAHTAVCGAVVWLEAANGPAFEVEIFRTYADKLSSGLTPYANFFYEYPPASLFILALPRLLTSDPTTYAALFGLEVLLFDWIVLYILSKVGLKPLLLYGIGLLLFWRVPYIRHDLVPVAFSTLGAFALLRGRALLAAFFWGAGGALKLYPLVGVPALAFGATFRRTFARWSLAAATFALGILWGVVAFGPKVAEFLTYHSQRPAQIESLPGNIQLLLPRAGIVHTFGSFNVTGPKSGALVGFFSVFQLFAVLLVLGVAYLQGRGKSEAGRKAAAVRASALATFAFAAFGKVLAWHYLFWPLPLLAMTQALTGLRFPKTTWGLYFAAILVTTLLNEQYREIQTDLPYFAFLLTARNLLLLLLFALLLLRPEGPGGEPEKAEPDQSGV